MTWRWVERPFRDTHAVPLRKLVRYSIGCAVFLISVGAAALVRQGFPQRLDPTAYALQEAGKDFDPLRERCAAYSFAGRSAECRFGANNGDPTFVVWGDSHAAAMRPAIEIAMAGRAGSLWWQSGCPPLVGAMRTPDPDGENCTRFHQQTLRDLQRSPEIGTVFVVGRWVSASTGVVPEIGGSHLIFLIDRHSTEQTQAETFRVFSRSLRRSVRMLKAMGKRVVLVGAVPEPGFDVPTIAALARHNQVSAPISLGRDQVAASNARTDSVFRALSRHEGVEYVSMWEQFCDRRCPIIEDGVPLYVDDDHLTQTASARLGPYIASQLYRQ